MLKKRDNSVFLGMLLQHSFVIWCCRHETVLFAGCPADDATSHADTVVTCSFGSGLVRNELCTLVSLFYIGHYFNLGSLLAVTVCLKKFFSYCGA